VTLGPWNFFRTAILTAFGHAKMSAAYAASSSFLRLTNKLTSAQVTNSRCASKSFLVADRRSDGGARR
jgi:hypothetical protein